MAESLSSECTPLKQSYDACFNAWFEGYLQPALEVSNSSNSSASRAAYSKEKATEFDSKCGKIWTSYKSCVMKAVKANGLDKLLDEARQDHPQLLMGKDDSGS